MSKAMDFFPNELSPEDFARLQEVQDQPLPPNAGGRIGDLGQSLAAMLGLAPFVGEPRSGFWKRNLSRTMPPSLQEPQGHDIELPAAQVAVRKALTRR